MKITASRTVLNKALKDIRHAVPTKHFIPALGGVLMRGAPGSATVSGTNLDVWTEATLDDAAFSEGSALIPGVLLGRLVDAAPKGSTVTIDIDDGIATIQAEDYKAQVRCLPAEDFPERPEDGDWVPVVVEGVQFADAVDRVFRSAARDDGDHPEWAKGIRVEVQDGMLTLAGCTAHHLSWVDIDVGETDFEIGATIPAQRLVEVAKVAAKGGDTTIGIGDRHAYVDVGGTWSSVRLLDVQYPNWRSLVTQQEVEDEAVIEADADVLSDVVGRVALLASPEGAVVIATNKGSATVSTRTPDLGEAEEPLPCDVKGDDTEVWFSPAYLLDGLAVVGGDRVRIRIRGYKAARMESEGSPFGHLLMPIKPPRVVR